MLFLAKAYELRYIVYILSMINSLTYKGAEAGDIMLSIIVLIASLVCYTSMKDVLSTQIIDLLHEADTPILRYF